MEGLIYCCLYSFLTWEWYGVVRLNVVEIKDQAENLKTDLACLVKRFFFFWKSWKEGWKIEDLWEFEKARLGRDQFNGLTF